MRATLVMLLLHVNAKRGFALASRGFGLSASRMPSGASVVPSDAVRARAERCVTFIDASPTPYHCAANVQETLAAAGFVELREDQPWAGTVVPGGKYFLTRHEGTIVAVAVGVQRQYIDFEKRRASDGGSSEQFSIVCRIGRDWRNTGPWDTSFHTETHIHRYLSRREKGRGRWQVRRRHDRVQVARSAHRHARAQSAAASDARGFKGHGGQGGAAAASPTRVFTPARTPDQIAHRDWGRRSLRERRVVLS